MTDTPMTPDRLSQIQNRNLDEVTDGPWLVADGSGGRPVVYVETLRDGRTGARVLLSADGASEADVQFIASARQSVPELLAEVDRLRKALSDAAGRVDFLERNTLPDLNRQIEHHKDGKDRWRKRAETAESRPAEAHVLRSTAAALEDAHPDAEAVVLELANRAERAAAARPWVTSAAQQPNKNRTMLSDCDRSRVEFARRKHAELDARSGDYAERLGSMSALTEILLDVINRAEEGGTP